MKAQFNHIAIRGIRAVVPSQVSHFDDEVENYSHGAASARKLKKLMGYDKHRVAPAGVCTSDLVAYGIERLVADGLIEIADIDALVLVTQTPDYVMPPTSSVLHGRLGLRQDAYCVDINQGCTGYLVGLLQASMLIQAGAAETVVLAVGDVLSHKVSNRDRNSYPLIGDAAAITIVSRQEGAAPYTIRLHADGTGAKALIIPAGGARSPSTEATRAVTEDENGNFRSLEQLVMQGGDVFNFTQRIVPGLVEDLLADAECAVEDIDGFMFHQANAYILKKLARKIGADRDKMPSNICGTYGNSSSATIPMAITDSLGPRVVGAHKVCMAGFGVGLTWGGAVIDLVDLLFCDIVEYEDEEA